MIIIVAKNYVKSSDRDNFLSLSRELIEKSRDEEGCISYNLYEDINGGIFTFIEEWKDEYAIEFHNNSVHFKTIVPKLKNLLEKNMEVSLYKKLSI